MSLAEEESPSPASSTFEGNDDNNQTLPLSSPEPPNVSAYCHLPAPYIPLGNLSADGTLMSSLGSSGISSGFASLEPFPSCRPMDVSSGDIYSGTTKPIPDTPFPHDEDELNSGSLSHMVLPDIKEAFHELCTSLPDSFWASTNITSPRSDYHSVISLTSGLATPATTPLPPSSTAAPMPDWCQLSSPQSLDQMIRQLALYRVQTTGVPGGEFPAEQS